jgi:hypothetical protein
MLSVGLSWSLNIAYPSRTDFQKNISGIFQLFDVQPATASLISPSFVS